MLKRTLNIINALGDSRSCLLLGPRGTGKSFLLHQLRTQVGQEPLFFDLLNRDEYLQLLNSPRFFKDFLRSKQGPNVVWVIVDEVQKLPELLDDVHAIIEEDSRAGAQHFRFILTGSSARKLKRGAANLLAGRAVSLKLYPLTFEEVEFSDEQALQYGLLPRFFLSKQAPIAELKSYAETYIREEVFQEALVRKIQAFEKFLDLAAQINGEPVNFSKIGKAAGVSGATIESFFQILTDILLVHRLDVWSYSVRTQVAAAPKYYFFDTGVLNALRGELSVPLKPSGFRLGKLFETLVINQLRALMEYHTLELKSYFWRTQAGQEVDLILARNPADPPLAIEIKSADSVDSSDLLGLQAFKREHPEAKLFCLCRAARAHQVDGVAVLPWREGIREILRSAKAQQGADY
jgi:predicted AAA+ superfamily ATPase